MELYIQIKDGQPFEHPILGSNFRRAFPQVDVENLPSRFARFERIEPPSIGVYEIYLGVTYEWDGNIVKDVHHVRPMTEQEIKAKQDLVKANWQDGGFASWLFDGETCSFIPPIPYPEDGKTYVWNEETQNWIE